MRMDLRRIGGESLRSRTLDLSQKVTPEDVDGRKCDVQITSEAYNLKEHSDSCMK